MLSFLPRGVRKFIANIVGGFIPDCFHSRRIIRVNVAAPLGYCLSFVHKLHPDVPRSKIERFYGGGGKGLVLGIKDKCVYKFSCMRDADKVALREQELVKHFQTISPIYIPDVELIKSRVGLVRRYPYVNGTPLSQLSSDTIIKNAVVLGKQIAEFLYAIGSSNPPHLDKYKQRKCTHDIPRLFYGWNHSDFDNLENFIVDPKTMQIIAVIDWENAMFGDFYNRFYRNVSGPVFDALFGVVKHEYQKLYNKNATCE